MKQIFDEYGKALLAAVAVIGVIAVFTVIMKTGMVGTFQDYASRMYGIMPKQDTNVVLTAENTVSDYQAAAQIIEVSTHEDMKLIAKSRYSIYSLVKINGNDFAKEQSMDGEIAGLLPDGSYVYIKVISIYDETNTPVLENLYDTSARTVCFENEGFYRMRIHITGQDGTEASRWIALVVQPNDTECITIGDHKAEDGHIYEEKKIFPTCTEKGYLLHTCIYCGHQYRDCYENATGHRWTDKFTTDREATCTENGEKSIHCLNSHYAYDEKGEVISIACDGRTDITAIPKGHLFTKKNPIKKYLRSNASCKAAATYYYACARCDVAGTNYYTYGKVAGHSYVYGYYSVSNVQCWVFPWGWSCWSATFTCTLCGAQYSGSYCWDNNTGFFTSTTLNNGAEIWPLWPGVSNPTPHCKRCSKCGAR